MRTGKSMRERRLGIEAGAQVCSPATELQGPESLHIRIGALCRRLQQHFCLVQPISFGNMRLI